jgi:S1-C subfamily serine protease
MNRFASTALPALIGALAAAAIFSVLAIAGAFDSDQGAGGSESGDAPAADTKSAAGGAADVASVYTRSRDAIVNVEARQNGTSERASGSGFLIDSNGSIVTNHHVVENADEVRVRFGENGDPVEADVKGDDPSTDLALLKVDPGDIAKGADPLDLSRSDSVRVGEPAIAIGSPFGLEGSVTTGIISALDREIRAPNGFTISGVFQTDAAINPGNSGGPLLDEQGDVIGVNAQIATNGTRANSGVGFAIPVDTVRNVIPALQRDGEIERAYLGVSSAEVDSEIRRELKLPADRGALLQEVVQGGPADDANLRGGERSTNVGVLAGGDLIVAVGGEKVDDPSDLARLVASRKPGERVEIQFFRGNDRRSVTVELGQRPEQARSG